MKEISYRLRKGLGLLQNGISYYTAVARAKAM